jgi:hypothetical protein
VEGGNEKQIPPVIGSDPLELRNLASRPELAGTVRSLVAFPRSSQPAATAISH